MTLRNTLTLRELAWFLAYEKTNVRRYLAFNPAPFRELFSSAGHYHRFHAYQAAATIYPELKSAVEEICAWIAITEHSRDIPIDQIVSNHVVVDVQKIRELAEVIALKKCATAFYCSQVF